MGAENYPNLGSCSNCNDNAMSVKLIKLLAWRWTNELIYCLTCFFPHLNSNNFVFYSGVNIVSFCKIDSVWYHLSCLCGYKHTVIWAPKENWVTGFRDLRLRACRHQHAAPLVVKLYWLQSPFLCATWSDFVFLRVTAQDSLFLCL